MSVTLAAECRFAALSVICHRCTNAIVQNVGARARWRRRRSLGWFNRHECSWGRRWVGRCGAGSWRRTHVGWSLGGFALLLCWCHRGSQRWGVGTLFPITDVVSTRTVGAILRVLAPNNKRPKVAITCFCSASVLPSSKRRLRNVSGRAIVEYTLCILPTILRVKTCSVLSMHHIH